MSYVEGLREQMMDEHLRQLARQASKSNELEMKAGVRTHVVNSEEDGAEVEGQASLSTKLSRNQLKPSGILKQASPAGSLNLAQRSTKSASVNFSEWKGSEADPSTLIKEEEGEEPSTVTDPSEEALVSIVVPSDLDKLDPGENPRLVKSKSLGRKAAEKAREVGQNYTSTATSLATLRQIMENYEVTESAVQKAEDESGEEPLDYESIKEQVAERIKSLEQLETIAEVIATKQEKSDEITDLVEQRKKEMEIIRVQISNLGNRRDIELHMLEWETQLALRTSRQEKIYQRATARDPSDFIDKGVMTVDLAQDENEAFFPLPPGHFLKYGGRNEFGKQGASPAPHGLGSAGGFGIPGSHSPLRMSVEPPDGESEDNSEFAGTFRVESRLSVIDGPGGRRGNRKASSLNVQRKPHDDGDRKVKGENLTPQTRTVADMFGADIEAPQGKVTLLAASIKQSEHAEVWEKELPGMLGATLKINGVVRQLIKDTHGYLLTLSRTDFTVAFQTTYHALDFAVKFNEALLSVDWSVPLLRFKSTAVVKDATRAEGKIIFRGPRAAIVVHSSELSSSTSTKNCRLRAETDFLTRRVEYIGPEARVPTDLLDYCRGGEIMMTPFTWETAKDNLPSLALGGVDETACLRVTDEDFSSKSYSRYCQRRDEYHLINCVFFHTFDNKYRATVLGQNPRIYVDHFANLLGPVDGTPQKPNLDVDELESSSLLPAAQESSALNPEIVAIQESLAAILSPKGDPNIDTQTSGPSRMLGLNITPFRSAVETSPATFVVVTIPQLSKILSMACGWRTWDQLVTIMRSTLSKSCAPKRIFEHSVSPTNGDQKTTNKRPLDPKYIPGTFIHQSFDEISLMFRSETVAVQWALVVNEEIKQAHWPAELRTFYYQQNKEEDPTIWGNGPRLSIGIAVSVPQVQLHRRTGLYQYDGLGLAQAREMACHARGCETLASSVAFEAVKQRGLGTLEYGAECINPHKSNKDSKIYRIFSTALGDRNERLGEMPQDVLVRLLHALHEAKVQATQGSTISRRRSISDMVAGSGHKSTASKHLEDFLLVARNMSASHNAFDSVQRNVSQGHITDKAAETFLRLLHQGQEGGLVQDGAFNNTEVDAEHYLRQVSNSRRTSLARGSQSPNAMTASFDRFAAFGDSTEEHNSSRLGRRPSGGLLQFSQNPPGFGRRDSMPSLPREESQRQTRFISAENSPSSSSRPSPKAQDTKLQTILTSSAASPQTGITLPPINTRSQSLADPPHSTPQSAKGVSRYSSTDSTKDSSYQAQSARTGGKGKRARKGKPLPRVAEIKYGSGREKTREKIIAQEAENVRQSSNMGKKAPDHVVRGLQDRKKKEATERHKAAIEAYRKEDDAEKRSAKKSIDALTDALIPKPSTPEDLEEQSVRHRNSSSSPPRSSGSSDQMEDDGEYSPDEDHEDKRSPEELEGEDDGDDGGESNQTYSETSGHSDTGDRDVRLSKNYRQKVKKLQKPVVRSLGVQVDLGPRVVTKRIVEKIQVGRKAAVSSVNMVNRVVDVSQESGGAELLHHVPQSAVVLGRSSTVEHRDQPEQHLSLHSPAAAEGDNFDTVLNVKPPSLKPKKAMAKPKKTVAPPFQLPKKLEVEKSSSDKHEEQPQFSLSVEPTSEVQTKELDTRTAVTAFHLAREQEDRRSTSSMSGRKSRSASVVPVDADEEEEIIERGDVVGLPTSGATPPKSESEVLSSSLIPKIVSKERPQTPEHSQSAGEIEMIDESGRIYRFEEVAESTDEREFEEKEEEHNELHISIERVLAEEDDRCAHDDEELDPTYEMTQRYSNWEDLYRSCQDTLMQLRMAREKSESHLIGQEIPIVIDTRQRLLNPLRHYLFTVSREQNNEEERKKTLAIISQIELYIQEDRRKSHRLASQHWHLGFRRLVAERLQKKAVNEQQDSLRELRWNLVKAHHKRVKLLQAQSHTTKQVRADNLETILCELFEGSAPTKFENPQDQTLLAQDKVKVQKSNEQLPRVAGLASKSLPPKTEVPLEPTTSSQVEVVKLVPAAPLVPMSTSSRGAILSHTARKQPMNSQAINEAKSSHPLEATSTGGGEEVFLAGVAEAAQSPRAGRPKASLNSQGTFAQKQKNELKELSLLLESCRPAELVSAAPEGARAIAQNEEETEKMRDAESDRRSPRQRAKQTMKQMFMEDEKKKRKEQSDRSNETARMMDEVTAIRHAASPGPHSGETPPPVPPPPSTSNDVDASKQLNYNQWLSGLQKKIQGHKDSLYNPQANERKMRQMMTSPPKKRLDEVKPIAQKPKVGIYNNKPKGTY